MLACTESLATSDPENTKPRTENKCENISALAVQLQNLLENCKKFVLVFDGIDKQKESAPTLLPALARLGEIVCVQSTKPLCYNANH
jgi:origin recognition complex subunit 5